MSLSVKHDIFVPSLKDMPHAGRRYLLKDILTRRSGFVNGKQKTAQFSGRHVLVYHKVKTKKRIIRAYLQIGACNL